MIDSFQQLEADAFADMWHDSVALLVGSDAEEWWTGSSDVKALIHAQFAAMRDSDEYGGPVSWNVEEVQAWSAGEVGWAAARSSVRVADGPLTTIRVTVVFVLERGAWRVTHVHLSHAVPNVIELPTSIEQILDAVSRDDLDLSSLSTDAGPVTVAFTDIESSTEIAAALGDAAWFELLQHHDEILSACMARRGGVVVKTIGDGAMLAFESGAEALLFASELRKALDAESRLSKVRVRIGVHCGDAIQHRNDFYGTTVNFAARVTAAAAGNQTLVSSAVCDDVSGDERFVLDHAGRYELKGIAGAHELFELV